MFSNTVTHENSLRCSRCGYLLLGLPENRCPECGLQFDLDAIKSARQRLLQRQPWKLPVPDLLILASAGVAALQLWILRLPQDIAGTDMDLLFLYFLWFVLMAFWLVRLLYHLTCFVASIRWRDERVQRPRWKWAWWTVTPAILMVTLALAYYEIPMRVAFYVSRPTLDRLVRNVQNLAGRSGQGGSRAGLFVIHDVQINGSVVVLTVEDFNNKVIFEFSPNSPPSLYNGRNLGGGWYVDRQPDS